MNENLTRRDFMLGIAALGLASGGAGVGYRAVNMPEIDSGSKTQRGLESTPTVEAPPTHNRGTLVITQKERVGNTYLDYIENAYKKFEPFQPYGYIVIGGQDKVEDGEIHFSKDSLMGPDRATNLPYFFSKSIAMGILPRGKTREISPYLELMKYTDRIKRFPAQSKEKAFAILGGAEAMPEAPEDVFAMTSAALNTNIEGVYTTLKELPLVLTEEFNYGGPTSIYQVESEEYTMCKELIFHTLNIYDSLLPKDMGNSTKSNLLNGLFNKVGVMRYELFRT